MKALKLAVAESSAILRCGIIALLHRMPAANVDILEIGDISQLAAQLSRHRPDVLIVNPASLGLCTPCLLYTSPSPRDRQKSRMPSSA